MMAQLDRDQETNALLAGDIRRAIRVTALVVGSFAIVLLLGADATAAVTLVWVIGVPLFGLSLLARLLARCCGDTTVGRSRSRSRETGRTEPAAGNPVVVDPIAMATPPTCSSRSFRQLAEPPALATCRLRPADRRRSIRKPIGWHHDVDRSRECDG